MLARRRGAGAGALSGGAPLRQLGPLDALVGPVRARRVADDKAVLRSRSWSFAFELGIEGRAEAQPHRQRRDLFLGQLGLGRHHEDFVVDRAQQQRVLCCVELDDGAGFATSQEALTATEKEVPAQPRLGAVAGVAVLRQDRVHAIAVERVTPCFVEFGERFDELDDLDVIEPSRSFGTAPTTEEAVDEHAAARPDFEDRLDARPIGVTRGDRRRLALHLQLVQVDERTVRAAALEALGLDPDAELVLAVGTHRQLKAPTRIGAFTRADLDAALAAAAEALLDGEDRLAAPRARAPMARTAFARQRFERRVAHEVACALPRGLGLASSQRGHADCQEADAEHSPAARDDRERVVASLHVS